MSSVQIRVTPERATYVAGEQVSGRVEVVEGGEVRKLDVSLRCRDSTLSYQGTSWSATSAPLATGELTPPATYSFSIALPADAAPTFNGEVGEIWWELDARCDVPGKDVHATTKITVEPARLQRPAAV
jgi:hypothetical protein